MAERMWGVSAWGQEGVSETCSHLDSSKNRSRQKGRVSALKACSKSPISVLVSPAGHPGFHLART